VVSAHGARYLLYSQSIHAKELGGQMSARPEQFRQKKYPADVLQTSPRRVHDLVRTAIRDGILLPDAPLVEDYLVRELATSRNAVREAMQSLASEGLVRRQRREGTTVVGGVIQIPLDDIVSLTAPEFVQIERLDDRKIPSTDLIRSRLQTSAEEVGMIEHLFSFDGKPIGIRVAYYHTSIQQPRGWERCPDLVTAFEIVFGLPLGRVETRIDAVACDARTSKLLSVAIGTPCLVKEQVLYDSDETPQEFCYAHYRSDLVSFVVGDSTPAGRATA
jgi:GntR family transcriptional regulator